MYVKCGWEVNNYWRYSIEEIQFHSSLNHTSQTFISLIIPFTGTQAEMILVCLLYTSDAADE